MAYNLPTNPSVGDTTSANGTTLVCIAVDPDQWAPVQWGGPGTVITELSDGVSFTPPEGAISHQVILWPPGDDEAQIAQYTPYEMGASATVNIGTEADGTDSTFNPAGTGATLTAAAGYPGAWHLLDDADHSGATSYDFDITGYTAYQNIKFILSEVVWATVASYEDLYFRFSDDGGSTFADNGSRLEYGFTVNDTAGTIGSSSAASTPEVFIGDAYSTAYNAYGLTSEMTLYRPHGTTHRKFIHFSMSRYSSTGNPWHKNFAFHRATTDDITDVRIVNTYGAPANVSFHLAIYGQK